MNLQFEQPFEYRQPTRQQQLLGEEFVTAEECSIAEVRAAATAVPPDTGFSVDVEVQAGSPQAPPPARLVNRDAPDDCSQPRLVREDIVGANLFVRLKSSVEDNTQPKCYDFTSAVPLGGGSYPRVYTETLTATTPPDTGTLTLTAELVGTESGTVYDERQVEVNVSQTADTPPSDAGDGFITIGGSGDGDDGGDGDPLDIPGIDFPFVSDLEGSLAVLVLVLLLLFIISASL